MWKACLGIIGVAMLAKPAFATSQQIPVPEPSTLGLLAVGVAGVVIAVRLRNRK